MPPTGDDNGKVRHVSIRARLISRAMLEGVLFTAPAKLFQSAPG